MVNTENQALEKFDISDYKGTYGENFFETDLLLKNLLRNNLDSDLVEPVFKHLSDFGEVSGRELNDLIDAAHEEGKYGTLEKFDRVGNRVDDIIYCTEQKQARKLCFDMGLLNLDQHENWQHEFTDLHKIALAYILNQNGEGGVACPVAMTDGMIKLLRAVGTEEQKKKYLPMLISPDSDSHFMAGQYVTERVGGSNVSANRTIARLAENGKWILTGEKWFCSNPGDLWVTTARVEGSSHIGLFLVPRFKDNGELNNHDILRLKEIIGSRGKVTAEIVYNGVEADLIGKPSHGLGLLMRYVINVSRLHVSLGGLGMMRRAFREALAYTAKRTAYGKNINEFLDVRKKLLEMKTWLSVSEILVIENQRLVKEKNHLNELLQSLLKFKLSSLSTYMAHEAIMLHGGQGIIRDFSILPRLLNDSVINETWEGTHNIMQGHAIKALNRSRVQEPLFEIAEKAITEKDSKTVAHLRKHYESVFSDFQTCDADKRVLLREKVLESSFNLIGASMAVLYSGSEGDDLPAGFYDDIAGLIVTFSENGLPEPAYFEDDYFYRFINT